MSNIDIFSWGAVYGFILGMGVTGAIAVILWAVVTLRAMHQHSAHRATTTSMIDKVVNAAKAPATKTDPTIAQPIDPEEETS